MLPRQLLSLITDPNTYFSAEDDAMSQSIDQVGHNAPQVSAERSPFSWICVQKVRNFERPTLFLGRRHIKVEVITGLLVVLASKHRNVNVPFAKWFTKRFGADKISLLEGIHV